MLLQPRRAAAERGRIGLAVLLLVLVLSVIPATPGRAAGSGTGDLMAQVPSINEHDLTVGNIYQRNNSCGVAAATMILDYYLPQTDPSTHAAINLAAVAKTSDNGSGYVRVENDGTNTDQLIAGLQQAGPALDGVALTATLRTTDADHWFDVLKAELDAKLPVIVFMADGGLINAGKFHYGHFIVVSGYTADDSIIYHEPYDGTIHDGASSPTVSNTNFATYWGTSLKTSAGWNTPWNYIEVLPPGAASPILSPTPATPVTPTQAAPPVSALYVETRSGAIAALRPQDGSTLWSTSVIATGSDNGELVNNTLYTAVCQYSWPAGDNCTLYALNANTGATEWQRPNVAACSLDGATDQSALYCGDTSGDVMGLSLSTGNVVWRTPVASRVSAVTEGDRAVYVTTDDGTLTAVDIKSGSKLWAFSSGGKLTARYPHGIQGAGSMVIVGVYPPDSGQGPIMMYGLRAVDGQKVWSFGVSEPGNDWGPVAVGDVVVVGTIYEADGLDLHTGALRWRLPVEIVNFLTTVDQTIFIAADDGVFSDVAPATGATLWQDRADNLNTVADVTAAAGTVIVTTFQPDNLPGGVFAFNEATGTRLWSATLQQSGDSGTLVDETAAFASDGGAVYAFNIHDGSQLWRNSNLTSIIALRA